MKYFIVSISLFLVFGLSAQNNEIIKLHSERNDNIIKIYAENFGDESYEVTLNINSTGFKHTNECPLIETIQPGEKKYMTSLIAKKNEQATYSMSMKYSPTHPNMKKTQSQITGEMSDVDLRSGLFVFEKDGCGRCKSVITFLKNEGIEYTALNISKSAGDNSLMWKVLSDDGYTGRSVQTPVIVVNGKAHYNLTDYNALLKSLVE